jgi:hypothetical protein
MIRPGFLRRAIGRAIGRATHPATGRGHRAGWAAFRLELARSRRFGDPVTLVRAPIRAGAADVRAGLSPAAFVRVVDQVWVEDDQVYLVLPHATTADAAALLDRLAADPELRLARERVRIVTFPDDGLTEDVLVDALHEAAPPTPIRAEGGSVAEGEDDDVSFAVGGG